ncbi:TPA_asm: P6 [Nymphaea alba virus 1]|uniref:P6 n=1 Tax=Nymphaea alba virus 1 TaxID=2793733 RepID=A0A8D9PH08_9RHAB|nr:P6 [Nymphaea alba virus 1]DAF42344.1 TPA_asm: P6 [Nymphaea alba virus 1]
MTHWLIMNLDDNNSIYRPSPRWTDYSNSYEPLSTTQILLTLVILKIFAAVMWMCCRKPKRIAPFRARWT